MPYYKLIVFELTCVITIYISYKSINKLVIRNIDITVNNFWVYYTL